MRLGRKWIVLALGVVSLASYVALCSPARAGCNCDDTCGSMWDCLYEYGEGECTQGYEHRCVGGGCGSWGPFRADCFYHCEWENWWCPLTGNCEHIVAYVEACTN